MASAICGAIFAAVLAGCAASGGSSPAGGGGTNVTVPGTPNGVTATAGNAQVTLGWSASGGATSYHVKRATVSGGPYTQIAAPGAASYVDTGLSNGTKYFYVVSAVNSAGESANSAEVNATPVAPVSIPAKPSNLAATAGNAQVSLTWSASAGATSYHVKRATASGGPYTQIAAPGSASYVDTGLSNGTKYFYVVSAVNSAGESANSVEVNATPVAPVSIPAKPSNLMATAGNAQVSLTWSASVGATSYHVKRATVSGGPYTQIAAPGSASYVDTGLSNGTKYFYVVSAVNSAGESANSTEVNATPVAPVSIPAKPSNLAATAGNAQVSLTWSASVGATSYNVKRATVSGGPYTQIAAPTSASYTDTGLTNGITYSYVVSAVNAAGESANSGQASATPAGAAPDVTVTIDATKTHAISPYIYGTNFYSGNTGAPPLLTFDRDGGNRWTAYNWETNASNAGSDFLYENDSFLSSSNVAAEAVRSFIAGDQANGMASLVTFQLQGLVSADESGPVSTTNPPDLTRFKTVVNKKSTVSAAPFTTTPVTSDANVYMDEFAWALDQKFSGMGIFAASATHPTFIDLDNEPELWNSTHLEVQGSSPVTADNYIAKTISLAEALKDQFPNALIFGPVHYGFEGIYSWQGELNPTPNGANWFPDKYLTAIKSASTSYGRPVVDVYDFHWYAEDYDSNGTRIISLSGTTLSDAQVQDIVQSPRNLWDATYNDSLNNSNPWIYETLGNTPINILGRLQAKINAENPGMKLAITEYESGGWNHIAGTIAQADNLGIFGAQGLFAANFWPPNGTYSYALAGFRAYRGFDGTSASFGDTSLQASSSDVASVMVYASTDSKTAGRVVFVAINRSKAAKVTAISGLAVSGTAHLYQMTATSAASQVAGGSQVQPVSAGTMAASGNSITITLPALSVTTIEIQ